MKLGALFLVAFAAALGAAFAPVGAAPRSAGACAFSTVPTTYEATEDRKLYMQAMDLAGYNMLFPGDPFFSQLKMGQGVRASRTMSTDLYVPPTLLKSISWIESVTTQGGPALPFGAIGPALVSFDCGYGIAQVTSGMTTPLGPNGQPTDDQALVATHFAYNIGRGMAILVDKWNAAPAARPIVGIDTASDPHILENWYYAIWSYNGFTGPGANRSNHPLDPVYGSWPRTPYSCGPANDGLGHNRSLYPYQELVYGCIAHPPVVQGKQLWAPIAVTMPDLNNPYWRAPMDLKNFQSPYSKMDIPTPKPQHMDPTAQPAASLRAMLLGAPVLSVDRPLVQVTFRPGESASPATVTISNAGTGILPWKASANKSWIKLSASAGVAVGDDLPCLPSSPCDRSAALTITVDASQLLGSDAGVVHIEGLGEAGGSQDVAVFVRTNIALGVPGLTKN